MRSTSVRISVIVAFAASGCMTDPGRDAGLDGPSIAQIAPTTIVPGTELVVTGGPFVDPAWGTTALHLQGRIGDRTVDVRWPAAFVDAGTLRIAVDQGRFAELAGDGEFHGSATVEVVAATDRQIHAAPARAVELGFRTRLMPAPAAIATGVIFVNERIEIRGDGFLLGGDEGISMVRLDGCFTPETGPAAGCRPVATAELPVVPTGPTGPTGPTAPRSRTAGGFVFSPRIAGIQPGSFTGTVTLINHQPGAAPASAPPLPVAYDLITAQVFSVDPPAASLGQYVLVHGGGFAGGEPGAVTELELSGTLSPRGGVPRPVELTLIPDYASGDLVRYVVTTDDALGHMLDVRTEAGDVAGMLTPIVSYGADRVRGMPRTVTFAIAPVRQIVYLHFAASYVEALRDFGLGAVDARIRERIVAVCREAYQGVGLELRLEPPADFALFETVELVGIDPNDQGLFGYDNSPGKDSGNLRLYDRIGGVNAQTQADGYPGFGGVFLRSLFGFSQHPGRLATAIDHGEPVFDQIFDPFRPDRGGQPIASADLTQGIAPVLDGAGCPGRDRVQQIRCAIYVLGNLVGTTLAHEIGHSLGLANPYQEGFHDPGDAPNRLMDAGEARPFLERAVLMGQGPAVFCDDEYGYLRTILPAPQPSHPIARPGCS
jgi:hypothetical protein